MNKFRLAIDFTATRALTKEELDTLLVFCITQVAEPQVDGEGSIGYVDADYSTEILMADILEL
jgi:hypothetical protein